MNLKYSEPTCEHKDQKHYSRGLCKKCYDALPDVALRKKLSRRVTGRKAYRSDPFPYQMYQELMLLAFPDEVRAKRNKYVTAFRRRNPDKARMDSAIRRARIAGTVIGNRLDLRAVYQEARIRRQSGEDVHVDHIIPLSLGGQHSAKNLRIVPARVNLSKGPRLPTP